MAVYRPDLVGGGLYQTEKTVKSVKPVKETLSEESLQEIRNKIAKIKGMIQIPQTARDKYKKEMEDVIVRDYKDDFHLSDEERRKNSEYYDLFNAYHSGARKIRDIKVYIEKYREYLNIVKTIAKNNGVYDYKKFIKWVSNGKIEIYNLNPPILTGMKRLRKRENINLKTLAKFIVSDTPADEFYGSSGKEEFNLDDSRDIQSVLNQDEINYIKHNTTDDKYRVEYGTIYRFLEHEPKKGDDSNLVESVVARDIIKKDGMLKQLLMNDKLRSSNSYNGFGAFFSIGDEFEKISAYDSRRKKEKIKLPKFKGSILNSKDYSEFLYEYDEWYEDNTKVELNGSIMTITEANTIMARDMLERDGYDVRKLPASPLSSNIKDSIESSDERFISLRNHLLNSSINNTTNKRFKDNSKKLQKYKKGKQSFADFEIPAIAQGLSEAMDFYIQETKKGKGKGLR